MRQSDKRSIETTADDSIRKTLAAQSATAEANDGISRGIAAAELQRLIDRVTATHQDAVSAARDLVAAVASGGVDSISQAAQSALASAESAKTAADQLSGARTVEQAASTRNADEAALSQLTRLKAAFHIAPELATINRFRLSHLLESFSTLTASQTLGLLAGAAIFVLAAIGLVVLGVGILQTRNIVDKLSQIGYARGLITYILAIGTVAVALVLVVSALLGTDASKDSFDRGKEILTVLIGIFGTILGFYFGSTSSPAVGAVPTPSPSPSASASPFASAPSIGSPSPSASDSPSITATPAPSPSS